MSVSSLCTLSDALSFFFSLSYRLNVLPLKQFFLLFHNSSYFYTIALCGLSSHSYGYNLVLCTAVIVCMIVRSTYFSFPCPSERGQRHFVTLSPPLQSGYTLSGSLPFVLVRFQRDGLRVHSQCAEAVSSGRCGGIKVRSGPHVHILTGTGTRCSPLCHLHL